jgi:protein phosphatase PTC2/3
LRVFPGRLSVSRTFGDVEAKLIKYGGNPNVVIAEPEIQMIKIDSSCDYIILACDGIFEKMNNPDCVETCWEAINSGPGKSIHEKISQSVQLLLKTSAARRTLDNITVVMVGLENLQRFVNQSNSKGENDL